MIAFGIACIFIGAAIVVWVPIHRALAQRRENRRLAESMPSYHGANRSLSQRDEIRRRSP